MTTTGTNTVSGVSGPVGWHFLTAETQDLPCNRHITPHHTRHYHTTIHTTSALIVCTPDLALDNSSLHAVPSCPSMWGELKRVCPVLRISDQIQVSYITKYQLTNCYLFLLVPVWCGVGPQCVVPRWDKGMGRMCKIPRMYVIIILSFC